MISTNSYKIQPKDYLNVLFKSFKMVWIIACAILIVCAATIVFDIRFIYVLLMVTFIVYPMIISYLYIWHGLKPETRYSILEKYITIDETGILLNYEETSKLLRWSEFKGYKTSSKYIILIFNNSNYLFFLIPYSAYKSIDNLRESMKYVNNNIRKNYN